jgi:AraC-like DNA-binding protein
MPLQDPLTLSIKGMVCNRCIKVLKQEFEQMGLRVEKIHLGSVKLLGTSHLQNPELLKEAVEKHGFTVLEDQKQELLNRIRTAVIRYYDEEMSLQQKLGTYLSEQLNIHYDSLGHLFSSMAGMTLEHFAQQQRLEKVKEMLVYTGLPLTDIAVRTGFSSVSHLSNHFKAMTGLPPSHFRKLQQDKKQTGSK